MARDPFIPYGRIPRDKDASYKAFLEDKTPADEMQIHESLRAFQAEIVRGIEESDELLKSMTASQRLAQFRRNTSIKHT